MNKIRGDMFGWFNFIFLRFEIIVLNEVLCTLIPTRRGPRQNLSCSAGDCYYRSCGRLPSVSLGDPERGVGRR